MKRWMIVTVLMVSLLGAAGWGAPANAQDVPAAGPVQAFEVEDGDPIGLSPDGTMYAASIARTSLCVYATETQEELTCGSVEHLQAGIRIEDVVWSPDSTRLSFAENAFRYGEDGDLWVMDAASGEVTNLTDDGFEGSLFSFGNDEEEPTYAIDVAPAWTPDGQFITFSRSPVVNGERQGNDLAQVPAAGGEVEILATIPDGEPGSVYFAMGWGPSGETLYFSLTHLDSDHPDNGIWTYDKATGEIAPFAFGHDPDLGPLALLRVSPAGDRLLVWYPMSAGHLDSTEPILHLVDTATGALSTPEMPVPEGVPFVSTTSAAFSPDGQALLMVHPVGNRLFQVWVTELASGEQQLLIDGLDDAWLELGVMPSWGANGAVLLGNGSHGGYLFMIEGIGLSGSSPASVPSPVASPANGTFVPGSEAVTTELTPIFAAPDPNATVVLLLVPNQTVQIVSEPVENEFGRWYPIIDPTTQTIGYVQEARLGTLR